MSTSNVPNNKTAPPNQILNIKKDAAQALDECKRKVENMLKNGKPILQPIKLDKEKQKIKPETMTNLPLISKNTPIEILPPEVILRDIDINQTYEVVILVRNLANQAQRIRCFQPKTSYFRCDYDIQGAVGAGLAMKLVLTFETNQLADFHDELEIISEDFKAKIPLHAYMPQPNIIFEPFLNFGFCQVGKEKIGVIKFKNEGKREGTINLKFDKSSLGIKVDTSNFKLRPSEQKSVNIIYLPKEAGILRTILEVDIEGQSIIKHIDVSATSVDYFVFMIDENGNQSSNFDFGNMYFGQMKTIEGYLVNNSPKQFNFKTKFLLGLQSSADEVTSFQTPNQAGLEQTQRIMFCTPEQGTIDSYSQIPIKFTCKSRVSENVLFWTRYYAMTKEKDPDAKHPMIVEEYTYTCFFEFEGKNEPSTYMHLQVRGLCPTIKLSSYAIQFGECQINSRRDYLLTIENMNEEIAIEFSFSKVAHFNTSPKNGRLNPHQTLNIILSFEPKSLGKFHSSVDLELLDYYKIPIKVTGTATEYTEKTNPLRGPESMPADFKIERQFVSENKAHLASKKIRKHDRIIFTTDSSNNLLNLEGTNVSEKLDEYYASKNNKQIYNNYISNQRQKRNEKEKDKQLKEKMDLYNDKQFDKIPVPTYFANKDFDAEENKLIHPHDAEFWFGTNTQFVEPPNLQLEEAKDALFVLKPLAKYEPAYIEKMDNFKPDPNKPVKKIFPSTPTSQAEYRYCSLELTPEQLQKIFASPVTLDFGSVHVKSRSVKYFSVKNELKHCIMVKLDIENSEELKGTNTEPQIIPSMQTAGFEVILASKVLQSFRGTVTYTINGKHAFKFLVSAQIDPVKLELSKTSLKLSFPDNNMEMETSEVIKITNNGNAPGKFKWEIPSTMIGILSVKPEKGEVSSQGYCELTVTYNPSGNATKMEGDKLVMKVEDGEDQILQCMGYVTEAKCALKVNSIDLGDVPVSTSVTKYFSIKNTFKTVAVFHISSRLPPFVTVSPMRGKISPDQTQDIALTFDSPEETFIKQDIIINIRGGKQLRLGFTANPLIPKIMIKESEFDFGEVTYGNSASLPLTIINEGTIAANLEIDLEEKDGIKELDGIECLDMLLADGFGDDESSVMFSLNKSANEDKSPDENASDTGDDSDKENQETVVKRQFQVLVKPKSILKFILKFTPKDTRNYLIELPISLKSYGKIESLRRNVACKGMSPKFLLEPQIVEFKKKIINAYDNKYNSATVEIEISNPDVKMVTWKLDIKPRDENQPFTIKPSQGRLEPRQKAILQVSFQPSKQDDFQEKVPLYLEGEIKPYLEVILKGTGAYPKLTFDRREVILPIVPLGIEAKCTFRIINDGFENLTLKHKLPPEIATIPLGLRFPEGLNLGITKNKLKLEVSFKSKKPLSFTTEIQFIDDSNHSYPIKVSGTTDNCLFTNFPFLLRNFGDFSIVAEDIKPLRLQENDEVDSESSPRGTSVAFSKAGSAVSKMGRHILGYSPIPMSMLERGCEFIVKWLKENGLTQPIQRFPSDITENNGSQIFELITFLTGKSLPMKAKLDSVSKKNEKVKVLYKQYDDLIKLLKEHGALLNTIRPEYLLKLTDYNAYIKTNPNIHYNSNLPKLNEKNFSYLSIDSWTTLFYQILKIYYLARVNLKAFKSLGGIPPDKINVPDYYLDGSNLYNASEGLLLRWLEIHYEAVRGPGQGKRLTNFDIDLRDGQFYSAVIQSYVGANYVKTLSQLRQVCKNDEDYKYNAEKVIKGLEEIGLQSTFTAKDIFSPTQRETVLFILFLYHNLPHYISKSTIEFSCTLEDVLVKNIELKNNSNKPLCYWVKLEAHPDFSIENDRIKIEPSGKGYFPITYVSRVSVPVTGRIMFTNQNDGGQRAAAIVYDLKSNITGRKSRAEIKVEAKLYEMKIKEIQVDNPFSSDVEYLITIVHEKIPKPEPPKTRKKLGGKDNKKDPKKQIEEENIIPAFYIRKEKIQVRKNTSTTLQIQFLPFIMETQKCNIIFCDEKVGEIQYTIIGEVTLPNPIEPIFAPAPFYLEGDMNCPLTIPFKNPLLERARSSHYDRLPLVVRSKETAKHKQVDSITFELETLSQYITIPPTMTLLRSTKLQIRGQTVIEAKDKKKKSLDEISIDSKTNDSVLQTVSAAQNIGNITGSENKLNLALNFKVPIKDQEFKFTMRNHSKTDIRVYVVKITVLPKPVKAMIEMVIPARKTVTQEIPVINNSDKDWQFKVELKNNDPTRPWFSGPPNFVAKRKTKNVYPITFKPTWNLVAEARLQLLNTATNEQFEYELRGIGEEPLAEDHIIIYCKARNETFYEISINNPTELPVQYTVETDLPNPKGETQFTIPAKKTKNYKFSVTPILGGTYTGSITFFDNEERYIWYIVELRIESSKSEKPPVDLVTTVRKAIAFDISLSNPLKENATFEVVIEGEGLLGENLFTVLPGQTATYELIYSPLRTMTSTGSIAFVNEKLGEAWYEFRLKAEDPPVVRLPTLKCELGKIENYEIELENPSNKEVKVFYKLSNPHNFDVSPNEIIIPAYDSKEVTIIYMPSDLDVIESGEVVFESDAIGNWRYLVFGTGLPPTKFDVKVISGALNKDSSGTINFKNPFKEPITVNISLDITGKHDAFELLQKKPKVQIGALNTIQIPFSFLPKAISEYRAEIVVAMNEKITWRYPILGITESFSNSIDFQLKTKCRVKYEQELKINLPGVVEIDRNDTFSLELGNIPKEYQNTLSKWLTITSIKNTLNHPEDHLKFLARFIPMKPFKITLDIIVVKASGGRWKFKLILEAVDPDPDDTISIYSPINKTSSVSFKLTNAYKHAADFVAGFTPDSDSEFTVIPKSGSLDSYGREGTTFVVSFTPIEYGKMKSGKLIVQTDEMFWSYLVKGDFPKYVIPQPKSSKVENKLPPEVETKLSYGKSSKKNFLVENIKKSNGSPPRENNRPRSRSKSRSPSPPPKDNLSMRNARK